MADKQVPTFGSSHIDQSHETGHVINLSEREILDSRYYNLDDIGDCFSSADIKRMDLLVRRKEFEALGKLWALCTASARITAFENAKYFLEEDEAIRLSEKPEE